ncbi:Gfo/Idh/MocA family protein [candidate division KSB1 bacterium]
MTDSNVTVAVVGAGNWGKNHVRVLANMPGVRLKMVCDVSPERIRLVNDSFPEVETVSDHRRVLDDPDVRAVVVASSVATHYDLARDFINSGRDVLVEKPMALDSRSADDLVNVAEAAGRVLMVGHILVFHPAVGYLKKLVEGRELGDIFYIYSQRVNLGVIRRDENAMWSLGPHDISVINYLLDSMPVDISASGASYLQAGIEDIVFLNMRYPGGQMAHSQLSWLDPYKVRRMILVGSRKMVVFEDTEPTEKIKIYDKGAENTDYRSYGESLALRFGDIYIPRILMKEPLTLELEHFIESVRSGDRPITDGASGLAVVRILEEAQAFLGGA